MSWIPAILSGAKPDERRNKWKSKPRTPETVFRESGVLALVAGLRYEIICARVPSEKPMGGPRISHRWWITYRNRKLKSRERGGTSCLHSGWFELVDGDKGDAIAWKAMTILQRRMEQCTDPYFLIHSTSRFNEDQIHQYWQQNADAIIGSLKAVMQGR